MLFYRQKGEILDLVKKSNREKIGFAQSILQTFLRDERKVEFENNRDSKHNAIRVFLHDELEKNLVKWVHIMRENKILLSGPMVQEKAIEFF